MHESGLFQRTELRENVEIPGYYVSDELSIEATLEVTQHLAVCRACSVEIQRRRQVRDRLRAAVRGEPAPADLRGKVAKIVRRANIGDLKFLA